MTRRQLQILKKKYLREGYKMGLRKAALNEGWSYRRGYNSRWQDMAPNRFSKQEWAAIENTFTMAAEEAAEELGNTSPETVADHWQQTFIDYLVNEAGISARRLYNGAEEVANYFAQMNSEVGAMDGNIRRACDIIYDSIIEQLG